MDTTRTFRLQEDTIIKLEQIADKEKISVNQIVSNLLDNFTNWEHKANEIGFISFPKSLIEQMFDLLPNEKLNEIATMHAKKNSADIVTFIEKEYSAESFLTVFEKWATVNKIPFQKLTHSNSKYIVNFDMGINFSTFFVKFVKEVMESFETHKIEYTVYDNTVEFTLIPLSTNDTHG